MVEPPTITLNPDPLLSWGLGFSFNTIERVSEVTRNAVGSQSVHLIAHRFYTLDFLPRLHLRFRQIIRLRALCRERFNVRCFGITMVRPHTLPHPEAVYTVDLVDSDRMHGAPPVDRIYDHYLQRSPCMARYLLLASTIERWEVHPRATGSTYDAVRQLYHRNYRAYTHTHIGRIRQPDRCL